MQSRQTRLPLRRWTSSLLALALALPPALPLQAANHTNSSVSDIHVLNLTVNVDWDYDAAAPTQAGTGGIPISKEVLEKKILREVARSVYLMTDGRHRLGKVYVYKNSIHGQNVDIQILNKSGRSYASGASWQLNSGSTSNFLAMDNKAEDLRNYARVIAHELGHYVYGFADEYREDGKTLDPNDPGGPAGADFTRNSIMNDHTSFTRLSLAGDYEGNNAANNTAQARVYATDRVNLRGGSQWEVLVRDRESDPPQAKTYHNNNRVFFDAFKNFTAPATLASLTKYFGVFCDPGLVASASCGGGDTSRDQVVPAADRLTDLATYNAKLFEKSGGQAGADAVDGAVGTAFESFKVVFVNSPAPATSAAQRPMGTTALSQRKSSGRAPDSAAVSRNVILIDRAVSAAAFTEAKEAAESMVKRAPSGSLWALVVSPGTGIAPVVPLKPVDTERDALVSAIRGLSRQAGTFDAAAAYQQAKVQLNTGRADADMATVNLLTAQGTPVPATLGGTARGDRTAFNVTAFRLPAGATPASPGANQASLETLATASGGRAFVAKNAQEAIKDSMRAADAANGELEALLVSDTFAAPTAAASHVSNFRVTVHDTKVSAHWDFDPADKAKLSFRLITPAGTHSTLAPDSNLNEGYATIEVDNSTGLHNGAARAETVALAGLADDVWVDVQSVSAVMMTAELFGGSLGDRQTPALQVSLSGIFPVAKAQVTATIYRANDGRELLSNLRLADDGAGVGGVGVDMRADDGRYNLDLKGRLPAGDYVIKVRAETTAESIFQPNQVFAIGKAAPAVPVGAGLLRVEELFVTLEAGASGVLTRTSPQIPPRGR